MATKSLVIGFEFERAQRAHDCQASSRHRLERGHLRMSVRKDRGADNYCRECAERILVRDIDKLTAKLAELRSLPPSAEPTAGA